MASLRRSTPASLPRETPSLARDTGGLATTDCRLDVSPCPVDVPEVHVERVLGLRLHGQRASTITVLVVGVIVNRVQRAKQRLHGATPPERAIAALASLRRHC